MHIIERQREKKNINLSLQPWKSPQPAASDLPTTKTPAAGISPPPQLNYIYDHWADPLLQNCGDFLILGQFVLIY